MKYLILICFQFFLAFAWAESVPSVQMSQFQKGNYWRWLYSELDSNNKDWKPYYIERYSVVKTEESKLTIEMISSAVGEKKHQAHHKFVVDFKRCERAAKDPRFKNFSLEFYTKSFDPSKWELVSRNHSHIVFTEKFNCAQLFPGQKAKYMSFQREGGEHTLFQAVRNPPKWDSWYFLDLNGLVGVAAYKLFGPAKTYKFELIEQGSIQ